jgi:hypothetical protein
LPQGPDQQIIDSLESNKYLYHPGAEKKHMPRLVVLVDDIIASLHSQL